jgi:hypothetical protein
MLLKMANSYSVKLSRISKKMKGTEKGKLPKNVISGTQNVGCLQYSQGDYTILCKIKNNHRYESVLNTEKYK